MAVRRLEIIETFQPSVEVINAEADFSTMLRLAFIVGQRTAHYGPLGSKAFAAFLAHRLVNHRPQPGGPESASE